MGVISFLTATNAAKASQTFADVTFCLTRCRMAMPWTRYSSLFPEPKLGIWNLVPSKSLILICLVFRFLRRSVGGTYGMGGLTGGVPFLHSEFLRPSGGDLRFKLMGYCQSEISNKRHLNELLGGTPRILQRGSA